MFDTTRRQLFVMQNSIAFQLSERFNRLMNLSFLLLLYLLCLFPSRRPLAKTVFYVNKGTPPQTLMAFGSSAPGSGWGRLWGEALLWDQKGVSHEIPLYRLQVALDPDVHMCFINSLVCLCSRLSRAWGQGRIPLAWL